MDALVTKSGFAMPSREGENGFVRSLICFVRVFRRNIADGLAV